LVTTQFLITNTLSSGRIRKNDYTGGIRYKTANGTDIKIDKTGDVKPIGFGSKMINSLNSGGYLNEALRMNVGSKHNFLKRNALSL